MAARRNARNQRGVRGNQRGNNRGNRGRVTRRTPARARQTGGRGNARRTATRRQGTGT